MKAINISRFICDFLAFIRDFLFTIEMSSMNFCTDGGRFYFELHVYSRRFCVFRVYSRFFLFTFENELNELLYGRKQVGERERYINIDTFLEKMRINTLVVILFIVNRKQNVFRYLILPRP